MFGIEQGVFDVVHCWGLGQGGDFCLLGNVMLSERRRLGSIFGKRLFSIVIFLGKKL
jgi:hypothetical protein